MQPTCRIQFTNCMSRLFLVLTFFCGINSVALGQDVRKSVVEVMVSSSEVDHLYPWRLAHSSSGHGSGVIIDGQRILTAAHVIDNALMVEVRRVGSDKKVPATVSYQSDERDLAILTVAEADFFTGSEPMPIGPMPNLGEEITLWGFPVGGEQLAITKGIVSRIDFDEYVHSFHSNLVVQVDAAMNGGASGGAAIANGKLAGINFQGIGELDNTAFIIPSPVVEQFLTDISDGRVDGVPEMAFWFGTMSNPQMREYYGLSDDQSGVLITKVAGLEAENGVFKRGDVILSLDGEKIADDATVDYADGDRINLDWLVTRRQIGDVVPVTLLRDGKVTEYEYKLRYNRQQALPVVRHYSGFKPEYQVVGGLVFQELNMDFIADVIKTKDVPSWISDEFGRYKTLPLDQKEQRVFLSTILPDEINQDYEVFVNELLVTANDRPVISIDDLRVALADKSDTLRLVFGDEEKSPLVFSKKMLAEREPVIRKQFGY